MPATSARETLANMDPYAKVRRLLAAPDRRARLLSWRGADLVVDVGANEGQYAMRLRNAGFSGRVVSFEPGSEAFERLEKHAADDPLWDCRRLALGERRGVEMLNIAADTEGSSFLEVEPREVRNSPGSRFVAEERVPVERLDAIWAELNPQDRTTFLKLDTQGTELAILRGAGNALDAIELVDVELSLVPLYEGGPLLDEVMAFMHDREFALMSVEGVDEERDTGQMLQVDAIFLKRR
jgi:FkbM family methyltransferase